jgi:hypothetical protein
MKALAQLHLGSIQAVNHFETTHERRGAKVIIRLPLTDKYVLPE